MSARKGGATIEGETVCIVAMQTGLACQNRYKKGKFRFDKRYDTCSIQYDIDCQYRSYPIRYDRPFYTFIIWQVMKYREICIKYNQYLKKLYFHM